MHRLDLAFELRGGSGWHQDGDGPRAAASAERTTNTVRSYCRRIDRVTIPSESIPLVLEMKILKRKAFTIALIGAFAQEEF